MKDKVLVAMSGGVDSSVAAYLLKRDGFEVTGVTMCLGNLSGRNGVKQCCSPRDIEDARRISQILEIQHYTIDFTKEMQDLIIQPFISMYQYGETPNPCIECNKKLKFGLLMDYAIGNGFDFLATGHYAKIIPDGDRFMLKMHSDKRKDQSYFLYSIEPARLSRIKLPLSQYAKNEVREIARSAHLPVSNKPDSQDVCFFPPGGLREFFQSLGYDSKPGEIVTIDGNVIGKHHGIAHYTIGQRKGLGISYRVPLYVVQIDMNSNRLIVGEKKYLGCKKLIARQVNFLDSTLKGYALGKIRYGHTPSACSYEIKKDTLEVTFREPQNAVAPGQSVVLYNLENVIGGGIIDKCID